MEWVYGNNGMGGMAGMDRIWLGNGRNKCEIWVEYEKGGMVRMDGMCGM